jgi:O-antigen ligase
MWTKLPFHLLVWGAFFHAVRKRPGGSPAWRNAAGLSFVALALYLAATLPLSRSPLLSLRSFALLLPAFAGAFAIPVLFDTPRRVATAVTSGAAGVAVILAADLVRLRLRLGADLLAGARTFHPYVLNHPNAASVMGAAAAIALAAFALTPSGRPGGGALPARIAAALGALLSLGYIVILGSRGPQIAFACACACAGLLLPGWRRKLVWIAMLAVAAAVLAANAERVNRRFASADIGTFNERDRVWSHTWKLAAEHPVFGHGYGKFVFEDVYYGSAPPASIHRFPHAHSYWLQALFESGWAGVALHAAAWALLALRLARHTVRLPAPADRFLPGSVLLLMVLVHVYGLGDYPDEVVRLMQIWLVPVALSLTARGETAADARARTP